MEIDLTTLSPKRVYHTLTQVLIPRPIAWVLSENGDGGLNLAPFSFFTGVCSDPPIIMLSIGDKADGSPKDTRANIAARDHFVVHIPHVQQRQPVEASAESLPAEVSEVEKLGLETVPFDDFPLPRLSACRAAMACVRHRILEVGNRPQTLILGEVKRVYLDDAIATLDGGNRLTVDAGGLDPLARLGAGGYAGVRFGEMAEHLQK